MTQPTTITNGSPVVIHLSLALEDGTEVLSTFADEPLAFTLGDGTLDPALEVKLIGLKSGDEQSLILSGNDIYGERDSTNRHWIARREFPQSFALEEGQVIAFTTTTGEELAGRVEVIEDSRVMLDFNHPLSGRTLLFTAAILRVDEAE